MFKHPLKNWDEWALFLVTMLFYTEKTIRKFLNKGGNPNIIFPDGSGLLDRIVAKKYYDSSSILKLTLDKGADPNIIYPDGSGVLDRSIYFYPDIKRLQILIDYGADLNIIYPDGSGVLGRALQHNAFRKYTEGDGCTYDVIKLLLDNGADPNIKYPDGSSCLGRALGNKNDIKIIKLLLDKGADVNHVSKLVGIDIIGYSIRACHTPEMVQLLIDYGAPVNGITLKDFKGIKKGNNALHMLANYYMTRMDVKERNYEETVAEIAKILITAGIDKYAKNLKGQTAYEIAEKWERPDDLLEVLKI